MNAVLDALRFLTVLPAGRAEGPPRAAALAAFPLVGLLIGLAWGVTAEIVYALGFFRVTAVAGAFVLIVDALITGALHLDAFGDVVDGVASRRPAEDALAIMRQPTIGAVGAAGVTMLVVLRFGLLFAAVEPALRLAAVPVVGRAAMVLALAQVPVRDDSSLAFVFTRPRPLVLVVAGASAVAAVALAASVRGLAALVVGLVAAAALGVWWRRRFGGLTGDAVGAVGIVAETAALLLVAGR